MPNVKQKLHQLVDRLPNNCSVDEALYRMYVLDHIERGLADVAAGRVVPHDRAMKEFREWVSKSMSESRTARRRTRT
jgi:predicted transcriptional regulator